MIKVSKRAHRYEDRAGDPLDGLVNMFDVGIVLAVAFLLAALSSLNLTERLTKGGRTTRPPGTITVPSGATIESVPPDGRRTAGRGVQVGSVYRLQSGQLIYVLPSGASMPTPSARVPTPSPSPS
jgi:hypothetical protein